MQEHGLKETRPYRLGAVIPAYRHADRLPSIIARLRAFGMPVVVVDDGNDDEIAAKLASLHDPANQVEVERRTQNGGKGAAMKTGFRAAARRGWSHALQVDADGQHDIEAAPQLAGLSAHAPDAVICGVPVYDRTVPAARKFGRYLTHALVWAATMSREISDSMCGFRIYPLDETLKVIDRELIGERMDFDTEILVHLNWRGVRVVESPIGVTYPEGNVSNFRMLRDNVRMTLLHLRLVAQSPVRVPLRAWRRRWDDR
ncbi:MAG: glycosyltransferase [Alphaproteobacteria bacterium]|nr:glycosyltransferase [Alphaproteobacteria bacterium]